MSTNITGQDQYSRAVYLSGRMFTVTVSGTFEAVISVFRARRAYVDQPESEITEWLLVKEYESPIEENGRDAGGHFYKIGCAFAGFVSGTAVVNIY